MSIKEYERRQFEQEIIIKLLEAEKEARSSTERYSHEEDYIEKTNNPAKAGL